MDTDLPITAAVQAQQYRDLRPMLIQVAALNRRGLARGWRTADVEWASQLRHEIRRMVAELYPNDDETTRERMIAFAVAVAE